MWDFMFGMWAAMTWYEICGVSFALYILFDTVNITRSLYAPEKAGLALTAIGVLFAVFDHRAYGTTGTSLIVNTLIVVAVYAILGAVWAGWEVAKRIRTESSALTNRVVESTVVLSGDAIDVMSRIGQIPQQYKSAVLTQKTSVFLSYVDFMQFYNQAIAYAHDTQDADTVKNIYSALAKYAEHIASNIGYNNSPRALVTIRISGPYLVDSKLEPTIQLNRVNIVSTFAAQLIGFPIFIAKYAFIDALNAAINGLVSRFYLRMTNYANAQLRAVMDNK